MTNGYELCSLVNSFKMKTTGQSDDGEEGNIVLLFIVSLFQMIFSTIQPALLKRVIVNLFTSFARQFGTFFQQFEISRLHCICEMVTLVWRNFFFIKIRSVACLAQVSFVPVIMVVFGWLCSGSPPKVVIISVVILQCKAHFPSYTVIEKNAPGWKLQIDISWEI